VLDFGGNAEGTEVTVSDVVLKEHSCDDGTVIEDNTDKVNWNADSKCNLWNTCTFTNRYYYAPAWAQIADPVMTKDGKSYTISLPKATDSQWQAQCFFETDMATTAANSYDFRCILNSTKDIANATVKLFKNGDDNTFFFTKNVTLKAFEDCVVKMPAMTGLDIDKVSLVLDFGGNPADTQVTLSGIILKESSCNE
jgi:hypothetical protein